jgi:hypothetical protein
VCEFVFIEREKKELSSSLDEKPKNFSLYHPERTLTFKRHYLSYIAPAKENIIGFAIRNVTKGMEKVREIKPPVKASFSKQTKPPKNNL